MIIKGYFSTLLLFVVIPFFMTCDNSTFTKNTKLNSKYRFIYNNDGTEILGNRWHNFRSLTIEDVHSYVDVVAETPVTTFMICSGSMLTYYNSKYERPLGTLRDGQTLTDSNDPKLSENIVKYGKNYHALQQQNTDIIELCVNRAKEKGMEAFITMRMNDLHFTDPELYCPGAQSDIWLDHPEWRMGDHPGWHADGALNFSHQGVRDYKLNLIREQCESYNIDGFELDFMRFIVYFPYNKGHQYLEVMTDFVQQAKTIIDDVGKKRGRPVLLAVRVPARYDLCLEKGLDVRTWVNRKFVDMVTISSHWLGDPALPVREFREKSGITGVPVYASLESGQYNPYEFRTNGMYRAVAAHCLNQGADGIYLFNFFFKEFFSGDKNASTLHENQISSTFRTPELLNELGSMEHLTGRNKIYTLSDGNVEYGYHPNTPLPIHISPWDQIDVPIELAENFDEIKPLKAYIMLRIQKQAPLKIIFNDHETMECNPQIIQQFGRNKNLKTGEATIVRSIPVDFLRNGHNTISVRSVDSSPTLLKRIELAIQYGDIAECGYF